MTRIDTAPDIFEPPTRVDAMKQRIWDRWIPEEERSFYAAAGFGGPTGIGTTCALLVIDVQNRTLGSKPLPIREAVCEYPTSCGEYGWAALPHIQRLVDYFHAHRWPVFYPHVAFKHAHDEGQFGAKVPAVMQIPAHGYDFPAAIAPHPGDIGIAKYHASAFFGTSLSSYLIGRRIDTLIITGATTSGCVRSTVVDASSLNYKVVVAEDAVFDRLPSSHAMNLFDMASKYADVLPVDELVPMLDRLRASR